MSRHHWKLWGVCYREMYLQELCAVPFQYNDPNLSFIVSWPSYNMNPFMVKLFQASEFYIYSKLSVCTPTCEDITKWHVYIIT